MKLGAHCSIAGGYTKALGRIHAMGGNCLQIFSSTPRGWNFAKLPSDAEQFLKLKSKLDIDPVYFHASYLINLADEGSIGHLSKQSLVAELSIAPALEIQGSIVHLGSFKNQISKIKYQRLISNIKEILKKTPKESLFIIENAGNRKIGQSLEEIAQIIRDAGTDRVRVCLDTCHLFSSGYDLSSTRQLDAFLAMFDRTIGMKNLEVLHFNDSRDPFNSGRDRHENIEQGTLGTAPFRCLMTHKKTKHLPFIIETPGFDNKGPDKKNLDILKALAL